MTRAILIGFGYLSGTAADLFRMAQFCPNPVLLTDITKIGDLPSGMGREILLENIPDFVRFPENVPNRFLVQTKVDFIQHFTDQLRTRENLIIYYTGHGKERSLVLPNREYLSFDDFFQLILLYASSESQIMVILDCCYPVDFNLPYELRENRFRFRPSGIRPIPDILLITSCREDERSTGSSVGSFFTKFFLRILASSKIITLNQLAKTLETEIFEQTGHQQTIGVFASHPKLPVLWNWFRPNRVEYRPNSRYLILH